MLQSAFESIREDKAYQLYLSIRPNMTEEDYMPFEEFYRPENEYEEPENHKSTEEILDSVKEVMNSHSWR